MSRTEKDEGKTTSIFKRISRLISNSAGKLKDNIKCTHLQAGLSQLPPHLLSLLLLSLLCVSQHDFLEFSFSFEDLQLEGSWFIFFIL
ncbi:MAG TPA: hypothetical protein VK175_16530 [Leadbetterella sp.]|nr:hypothetical protein [Leadbetterella sp.]